MIQYSLLELYLAAFSKELDKLSEALQRYSKYPNANKEYILKKASTITALAEILDGLEKEYSLIEPLLPIAPILKELQDRDTEIGCFTINLWVKPNNNRTGLINYNPFKNYV